MRKANVVALDQIKAGTVDVKYLDATVKGMLSAKFALGLFESQFQFPLILYTISLASEDPYPYDDYMSLIRTPASRTVLHQADTESIVLLENRNNVLPLKKNIESIALLGPQANRVTVRKLPPSSVQSLIDSSTVWRLRLFQCIPSWHIPARRIQAIHREYFEYHKNQFCSRL